MRTIVYCCPFIPGEWIAAFGFHPSRISPGSKRKFRPVESSGGICSFVDRFLAEASTAEKSAAVCFTSVCDQMRRAVDFFKGDLLPPVFLMHVPSTWQSLSAQRLYLSELERLGRFLTELGGKPPSKKKLVETMLIFDRDRKRLRDLKTRVSPRDFAEAILTFNRTGDVVQKPERYGKINKGIPIALLGGPIGTQDFNLYDVIADAGGYVVLDGTETGERTLPRPFRRRPMNEFPLLELTDAYFGSIPDAFRRPNNELYRWMEREFRANEVRGIILVRNVWCDLWHGEVRRIQEWLNIPLLDVDLGGENPVLRNRMRIFAFLEILQS